MERGEATTLFRKKENIVEEISILNKGIMVKNAFVQSFK
jgi:hypothetical protein